MTKALILVGGYGTRLRPLTFSKLKPLVDFCNIPMVVHQVEALSKVGVDEVVLAVGYQPDAIKSELAEWGTKLGVKISYSIEETPMGTAGPLALAKDILLAGGDEFFVLNSDVVAEYPFDSLLEYHRAHGKEGTIMVTKVDDPSRYGVVVTKEGGVIDRFVEKPQVFVGDRINAGIYLFNTSILKRIPNAPTSIERAVFPVMASEGELYAMDLEGYWMDIGMPGDFIRGQECRLSSYPEEKLAKGDNIEGRVLIAASAKVDPTAVIGPNVSIGEGVVVGPCVRIQDSVVMRGCVVKGGAFIDNSILGWNSVLGAWGRVTDLSVVGEDVKIGKGIAISAVRVCPHKGVKANATSTIIL